MIRVHHWQHSGVAWVPWRIKELLTCSSGIDVDIRVGNKGCIDYGIGGVSSEIVPSTNHPWVGECDILHLHHDHVWQRMAADIRRLWPKVKVVVTIHGESDRSRYKRGVRAGDPHRPDAYHVVEPGLLEPVSGAAPIVELIPNHPARELPYGDAVPHDGSSLYVPWSAVRDFKNPVECRQLMARALEAGWRVREAQQRKSNDMLVAEIAQCQAVWVQLQGYLDILTMEAWTVGTLPVVLAPSQKNLERLSRVWGELPALPFTNRDELDKVLLSPDRWEGSVGSNSRFMETVWTPSRAALLWAEFYDSVECSS